jgi:penicillin amidase
MYLGLDVADSLDAWDAAARTLEVGAVNLVAADQRSIRYRVHANVPQRPSVQAGSMPWRMLDGRDPRTLWNGALLSEAELPSALDPERGYLCTANNDPWGFTADGRVDNDPFYYGNFYDPGDRAARIESELRRLLREKPGRVSLDDMKALQADTYSNIAEDLVPPLLDALARIGSDPTLDPYKGRPELAALGKRLQGWDRRMNRDSTEAVIFFAFAHFATVRAVGDDYGPFLPRLWQAEPAFAYKPLRLALRDIPGTTSVLQEGKAAILVGGLADAYDWLKRRFATPSPETATGFAWRDVHGARFDHVLGGKWNAGTVPVDGSVGTVNVSSSAMADDMGKPTDRFSTDAGSLYRMVVGFDDRGTPRAEVNFPLGNDGVPGSRFAKDQHPAWQDVRYAPLRFSRDEVEADTALRLRITTRGQVD